MIEPTLAHRGICGTKPTLSHDRQYETITIELSFDAQD